MLRETERLLQRSEVPANKRVKPSGVCETSTTSATKISPTHSAHSQLAQAPLQGVGSLSTLWSMAAMRPNSVFMPVSVTTMRPRPNFGTLPPVGGLPGASAASVSRLAHRLSHLLAASRTRIFTASNSRPSAGTPPASSNTISPGTILALEVLGRCLAVSPALSVPTAS